MKSFTLSDIATIERKSVEPSAISMGTAYVGLEHIVSGGHIADVAVVGPTDLASSKFEFGPEHILYGKLRPYLAKIALPDFPGVCSTDILPIKVSEDMDRRYLAYFLRQANVVRQVNSLTTGANLPRISPQALGRIVVPKPPLEQQRRIADILDKADELRAKRREAVAHLDSLSQSIFHEMFSGFAESTTVPLENLAAAEKGSIRTGPFGSQLLTSEFTDSGIAVLGIDNTVDNRFSWKQRRFISTEKFEKLKRYTVYPGDVVITIMGTLGRCAVIPDDIPAAINTKHLCCITLDREKAHPVFLHSYFLQHPVAVNYLRQTTKGSIMGGLNMGIIKSMPVIQPPLKLQTKFARRMAIIDSLRSQQQAQLAELDSLFMSLQDRAFKGDL